MARLPQPGNDIGEWGDILNDYLLVEHRPDGTHNAARILNPPQAAGRVLTTDPGSVSGMTWQPVTKATVGLAQVDNTADQDKPISDSAQQALNQKADLASLAPVATSGDYNDLANIPAIISDHGTLTGLGNDDHPQYLLKSGGALTGNVRADGGASYRAYSSDNSAYIELRADNFWGRITTSPTIGTVYTSKKLQAEVTEDINLFAPSSVIRIAALHLIPHKTSNAHYPGLGSPSVYWPHVYATRHYLNSTAYLDGATPGTVAANTDIEITDSVKGIVLRSPNGSRFRITVQNDGSLTTTAL